MGGRVGDYQRLDAWSHNRIYASYVAFHVTQRRSALLKLAHTAHGPTAIALAHEASILGLLRHPGVPAIQATGVAADGRFWLATERVTARTIAEAGMLVALEVAELLRDVAAILDHAHLRGVVVRALRPDAIVLADPIRGTPVTVADWTDAQPTGTRAPLVGADPAYVAPELLRGTAGDLRVDVYTLGAIAYRALCGVAPIAQLYVPAGMRCPGAPPRLLSLIDRMLAHDPLNRPASCVDVREIAIRIIDQDENSDGVTTRDGFQHFLADHLGTEPEIALAG